MSYPPSPPGGPAHPWAPRGPRDTGATSTWAPPAGPPSSTTGTWGGRAPSGPSTGAWSAPAQPPGATRPWAPAGWGGGYPSAPPAAGGGGMPPHPPGYRAPAGPERPAPTSTPTPAPSAADRSGRLMSAMVGGLVGAVVAALVAAGLVVATDDDPDVQEAATETTEAGGGSIGVGESLDIQEILDIARPSVVQISVTVDGQSAQAGSGFVYHAGEGLVLTNAHVVEGVDDVSVTFFDGQVAGTELVGSFPADDVAMLRVQGVDGLQAAELGSSDALQVGEDVVAIGNALGLAGEPTVTTGIVSALNREIETEDGGLLTGLIQTDAAINPGNSGGPLLNSRGQVVGINTLKRIDASNIGFALAIDNLRPLIEDLREGNGDVTEDTPFLGVSTEPLAGTDLPPELLEQFEITSGAGLLVSNVSTGSGAEAAGIEPGDVILEADGQVTNSNAELTEVIRSKAIGDVIVLSIVRRGEDMEVEVELGRRGG